MNIIKQSKTTATTLLALLATTLVSCSAFDSGKDGKQSTPETAPEAEVIIEGDEIIEDTQPENETLVLLTEEEEEARAAEIAIEEARAAEIAIEEAKAAEIAIEEAKAAEIAIEEAKAAEIAIQEAKAAEILDSAKDCNGETLSAEQLPLYTKLSNQFQSKTCNELILLMAGVDELDLSKTPEEACIKSFNDDKTGEMQNQKFSQINGDGQIATDRIADISLLKHFPQLKKLNISFLPIMDLAPLATLPNLETLKINRCFVVYTTPQSADFAANDIPRVKDITFVAAMPKLRELHLRGNALSDVSLIINSLPALEYLEVGKDRFTPTFAKIASVQGIAGLKSMTKLNIAGNQIFGDALNEVALMAGLVQLDLENNNIKDVSVLGTLSSLVPSTDDQGKVINPLKLFGNPIARTVSKDDQSCIKTAENCPTNTVSEALNLFCSILTTDGKGNCL